MTRDLMRSLAAVALMTVLCGLVYPLVVWAGARVVDPAAAEGSLVRRDGRVVGSHLIGQPFTSARYVHGRPSAVGYAVDGIATSGGGNLGPNARGLAQAVSAARTAAARREGVALADVPVDLVTSSASGLDPDISLPAALVQVPRVARARGLSPATVERLVRQTVRHPVLGLGSERVRVLDLNLALDAWTAAR